MIDISFSQCQTIEDAKRVARNLIDQLEQSEKTFAQCAIVRKPKDWEKIRKGSGPCLVVVQMEQRHKRNDTTNSAVTRIPQPATNTPLSLALWDGRQIIWYRNFTRVVVDIED